MDSGNQLTCSFFFPFLSFLTLYWSPDHRVGEQYWGESPYLTEVNLETLPQIYPKICFLYYCRPCQFDIITNHHNFFNFWEVFHLH